MGKRLREGFTFANVVSVTALFVALGGTAVAVDGAFQRDLGDALKKEAIQNKVAAALKNEIDSKQLEKGAVTKSDVAQGLPGGKLAEGSLKEGKLVPADRPYWIQVGSAGETQAHSGGLHSTRISQGLYKVTFPVDMSAHGITANRQTRDIANQGSDYTIVITRCGGGPAGAQCDPVHNTPSVIEVRMDKVGNNPAPPDPPTLDDAGFILSATP